MELKSDFPSASTDTTIIPSRFPLDCPPAFDNHLQHIKSPLTTTSNTQQPTMSAASKKSASSKPAAAAKKTAAKTTPSHPTWVDMIKVCSLFSHMPCHICLLAPTVLVSGVCDLSGQGKGRRGHSLLLCRSIACLLSLGFSAFLSTMSIVLAV